VITGRSAATSPSSAGFSSPAGGSVVLVPVIMSMGPYDDAGRDMAAASAEVKPG